MDNANEHTHRREEETHWPHLTSLSPEEGEEEEALVSFVGVHTLTVIGLYRCELMEVLATHCSIKKWCSSLLSGWSVRGP